MRFYNFAKVLFFVAFVSLVNLINGSTIPEICEEFLSKKTENRRKYLFVLYSLISKATYTLLQLISLKLDDMAYDNLFLVIDTKMHILYTCLSHTIAGLGNPVALQTNFTVEPLRTVIFRPGLSIEITGGTKMKNVVG